MASDQSQVMNQLGFPEYSVIGHDRGGRVAHRLAADHGKEVKKLMVLDISPTLAMYEQTNMQFARGYWHWFFLIQKEPIPETLISANTYTGATKISAGTLKLGANNIISNSSDIYFDGGNLSTGGFSDVVGTVYVSNAGSTLTLGSGVHSLQFANSDNSFVNNTLLIKNWAGTFGGSGSAGKIKFTNSQIATQLERFRFDDPGATARNAIQISSSPDFEMVPGDAPTTTNYSNLNISSAATSGGSWFGSSSTGWTFNISADNANILVGDIMTKLTESNGNVTLNTSRSGGKQTGAVFFSSAGTLTNTNSSARTLNVTAQNYIAVNQPLSFTTDGAAGSTAVVPSINFNSDAIYINAAIKLNAAASSNNGTTAASGGNISLTATNLVSIATTGSIEAKGANNLISGDNSKGGNGGLVSITGPNGISILGNINTNSGYSSGLSSTVNLSRPGKLIVSTNNSTTTSGGSNDGQTTNTLTIGDLEKNGTGTFNITNSVWGAGTFSTTSATTPQITVNAGKLRLLSNTSLSDGANLIVTSPGVLDLNGNNETISTISGSGTITSTSTSNILTLTTANTDVTTSTFSGTLGSVSTTIV